MLLPPLTRSNERLRIASQTAPLAMDLALRLTCLDLLLRPVGDWSVRPFIMGLAVVALLSTRWLREPLLWFALAALTASRTLMDWPLADNHAYLLAYWCLAVALACMVTRKTGDGSTPLAFNGRILIGLVFLFSCIWKLVASDNYWDATFFQLTFIVDSRFEGFVQIVASIDMATLERLREFVEQHRDSALSGGVESVALPSSLTSIAVAATTWNLFINAALAVTFLLPLGWSSSRGTNHTRHALLLTYCAVTYAIATVDGFGWLLLAMGAALCTLEQKRLRRVYVAVFMLIIFYREIPWADELFLPLLNR